MKIKKIVAFCDTPLTGIFRYRDEFQLYPFVDKQAPVSKHLKKNLFYLEYAYDVSSDTPVPEYFEEVKDIINSLTFHSNRQKEILNILTAITNFRFYLPKIEVDWFLPILENAEEMNAQSSQAGMRVYLYPGIQNGSDLKEFSPTAFPEIEPLEHSTYYNHLRESEVVKFPKTINLILKVFFSLKPEIKEPINAAASLICNGIDLMQSMKSLSFVSLISSIEIMVNYENKDKERTNCSKCGRPVFSVTEKFRNYIMKYVTSDPTAKKKINEIYDMRSRIVHKGLLLLNDNLTDWAKQDTSTKEFELHLTTLQISRASLANWMLFNGKQLLESESNLSPK